MSKNTENNEGNNKKVIVLILGLISLTISMLIIIDIVALGNLELVSRVIAMILSIVCGILGIVLENTNFTKSNNKMGKIGELLCSIGIAMNIVSVILSWIAYSFLSYMIKALGA